jgi:hypothetical protein
MPPWLNPDGMTISLDKTDVKDATPYAFDDKAKAYIESFFKTALHPDPDARFSDATAFVSAWISLGQELGIDLPTAKGTRERSVAVANYLVKLAIPSAQDSFKDDIEAARGRLERPDAGRVSPPVVFGEGMAQTSASSLKKTQDVPRETRSKTHSKTIRIDHPSRPPRDSRDKARSGKWRAVTLALGALAVAALALVMLERSRTVPEPHESIVETRRDEDLMVRPSPPQAQLATRQAPGEGEARATEDARPPQEQPVKPAPRVVHKHGSQTSTPRPIVSARRPAPSPGDRSDDARVRPASQPSDAVSTAPGSDAPAAAEPAQTTLSQAQERFHAGEYSAAAELAHRAVRAGGGPDAQLLQAHALMRLRRYDEAADAYRAVFEKTGNPRAERGLALAQRLKGTQD